MNEVKKWMEHVKKVRGGEMDLSKDEDLSIAVMNLVSLEEHFFFTAMKTDDASYLGMLNDVRKLRGQLMKKLVTDPQGEEWCISKHLLAASMRLMEVGTKELGLGRKKEAEEMFRQAFELYSKFFALNLKMLQPQEIKKGSKFSNIVKKIVDCCREW